MARCERCNLERERLFVRYQASVERLVNALGAVNKDGKKWWAPIRRKWLQTFIWYWGWRFERQWRKTRRVGDECRHGQDALKAELREVDALTKLEQGVGERDSDIESEILQLIIFSRGA